MKERPILYSAPMVVAILDGRKTQTRRVIKPEPYCDSSLSGEYGLVVDGRVARPEEWICWNKCPYGLIGHRLYVRETTKEICTGSISITEYVANNDFVHIQWNYSRPVRPSIHMPRSLSRILTEITDIRVQRLQDINPEEAKSEGLKGISKDGRTVKFGIPDLDGYPGTDNHGWPWQEWECDPVMAYKRLWEKINGKGSWDKNPWVWVVEFERILA